MKSAEQFHEPSSGAPAGESVVGRVVVVLFVCLGILDVEVHLHVAGQFGVTCELTQHKRGSGPAVPSLL